MWGFDDTTNRGNTMTGTSAVTNEFQLLESQIKRLEEIVAAPPLELIARHGGIEGPEHQVKLLPSRAMVIDRNEIETTLNRLRTAYQREMEIINGEVVVTRNDSAKV